MNHSECLQFQCGFSLEGVTATTTSDQERDYQAMLKLMPGRRVEYVGMDSKNGLPDEFGLKMRVHYTSEDNPEWNALFDKHCADGLDEEEKARFDKMYHKVLARPGFPLKEGVELMGTYEYVDWLPLKKGMRGTLKLYTPDKYNYEHSNGSFNRYHVLYFVPDNTSCRESEAQAYDLNPWLAYATMEHGRSFDKDGELFDQWTTYIFRAVGDKWFRLLDKE